MTDKPSMSDVIDALPKGNGTPRLAGKADVSELPDGRKITDLSRSQLADALSKLKIPGTSPNNTLEANRALYERHLQRLYDEGGEQYVAFWMVAGPGGDDDQQKDRDEEESDE